MELSHTAKRMLLPSKVSSTCYTGQDMRTSCRHADQCSAADCTHGACMLNIMA